MAKRKPKTNYGHLGLESMAILTDDLREISKLMTREQARGVVDLYYRLQNERKTLGNQVRAAEQGADPGTVTGLLNYFGDQFITLEGVMPPVLGAWAQQYRVGQWSMAQVGIGPVLGAGLLAHIDITKAPTAGAIWRFAGLDPTVTWEKGQKRPYNADLKVLVWKITDSFVKVSGKPHAVYGKLYRERKVIEVAKNDSGANAEAAARSLERNIKDAGLKAVLLSGKLPDGQVDARARRWVGKIFLSHWQEVAYRDHYKADPPAPYSIAIQGHAHYIPVPPG